MIEVFTTDVQNEIHAEQLLNMLNNNFSQLKINLDIEGTNLPYPCGHSILRVEGRLINSEKIINLVNKSGFMCDILEDKICH